MQCSCIQMCSRNYSKSASNVYNNVISNEFRFELCHVYTMYRLFKCCKFVSYRQIYPRRDRLVNNISQKFHIVGSEAIQNELRLCQFTFVAQFIQLVKLFVTICFRYELDTLELTFQEELQTYSDWIEVFIRWFYTTIVEAKTEYVRFVCFLFVWCFTTLSTMFQLYHGASCVRFRYYWPIYPDTNELGVILTPHT